MNNQLPLPLEQETFEGVQRSNSPLIPNYTPLASEPLSIAKRSLESLNKTFKKHGHNPDDLMWIALRKLAMVMESAVEGNLKNKTYVTSLDPGVGKTQSVIHFIHCLLKSTYNNVGVLICVSRINEIETYLKELNLPKEMVSIVTSDKEVNAKGADPISSPIMLTTQQMVESKCSNSSFENIEQFHYQHKPRKLRIWDEAILPGNTITLDRYEISSLLKPINSKYPKLSTMFEELFCQLKGMEDGSQYFIPDFSSDFEVELFDILNLLEGNEMLNKTAEALWFLSGRLITIRNDGVKGNTILDYKETLPSDILPLIVLDASARVRGTYALWERDRGSLATLSSAVKKYDDLNVHIWTAGGGKKSFKKNGETLIEGIASTINTKPDEEWLVVHHKASFNINVEKDVRSLLNSNCKKVHFIHWGDHHATNEYKDVPNVILAGTLFYAESHYEALGRLSSNKPADTGKFPKADEESIKLGEHSHLILQALCRASVRKCIDGRCAPCDAYIIASKRSGIPDAIPNIFPGCTVKNWKPVRKAVKGKAKQAIDYLVAMIGADMHAFVSFKELREHLGIACNSNFRKIIRQNENFKDALADAGLMENITAKGSNGFVKCTGWEFGFDDEFYDF